MTVVSIASAILRDRDRPIGERDTVQACHSCAPTYTRGDGRFCQPGCRTAFDNGLPAYDANRGSSGGYSLPMGRHGFLIACAACRKTFDSTGMRCCSRECERHHRARQESAATMAEVGMDVPFKRAGQSCGANIPKYQGNGRARKLVRSDARYCSERCKTKARKMGTSGVVSG